MNIAVCFYGQPRFIDNILSYESHKQKIFNQGNVDVFAHYWFDEEETNFIASDWSKKHNNYIHKNAPKLIKDYYNPVKIFQEKPKSFDENNTIKDLCRTLPYFSENNFYNLQSHLYSFEQSFNLLKEYCKENDKQYDFVVSTRFDNHIVNFPDLNILEKNALYIDRRCGNNFTDVILLFGVSMLESFTPYSKFQQITKETNLFIAEEYKRLSFLHHHTTNNMRYIDLHARVLRSEFDSFGEGL